MATPTSSHPPTRWERSGDPSAAFNGLSRGGGRGRGRGGYRGGRGGRGGNHGAKDSKRSPAEVSSKSDAPTTMPSTSQQPTPAPIQVSNSVSTDKSTAPTPTKPKAPSRRASRNMPSTTVNTQLPANTDPTSSPKSAKPSNRRRRSQASKPNATVPPKITPLPLNDATTQPSTAQLPAAPHTAPAKPTPPHNTSRSDMRHDIEAFVERVRASAMDNRPSTPGSHIDWAGDEDDSLPDLDDWGVTTSTTKSETISPIIVEGLRPLPDLTASITASPLRQVITLQSEGSADRSEKPGHTPSPLAVPGEEVKKPTSAEEAPVGNAQPTKPHALPTKPQSQASNKIKPAPKKLLHPSLPSKPVPKVDNHPESQQRQPSRSPTQSKATNGPNSAPSNKNPKPNIQVPTKSPTSTPAEANQSTTEYQPAPDNSKPPEVTIVEPPASAATPPPPTTNTITDQEEQDRSGLEASIHAPKGGLTDSTSAPASISSYTGLISSAPRDQPYTHTRAHTAPRFPPYPRSANDSLNGMPRFGRGGRGQGGFHARNHSSPQPQMGNTLNNAHGHRVPASRPVLTGAALSHLARTIGKTSVSPNPHTVATLGE